MMRKTAGNSEKQRVGSLLFPPPIVRQARISAGNEASPADNFQEKQRKQRKGQSPALAARPLVTSLTYLHTSVLPESRLN